jgi:hypothetical protein
MNMFLNTLEEVTTVYLGLKAKDIMQFYDYDYLETTTTNGVVLKNELTKLLHFSVQNNQSGSYYCRAEAFDRVHLCRDFSLSEKVFSEKIVQISDDVELLIHADYGIKAVLNVNQLLAKADIACKKLAESYNGPTVEATLGYVKNLYTQEPLVIKNLAQYIQYGLFFNVLGGMYKPGSKKTRIVKFAQLIPNLVIEIEESAGVFKIHDETTIIKITGTLAQVPHEQTLYAFLAAQQIELDETNISISLENYTGFFTFNNVTGAVVAAELSFELACGKNFIKSIVYKLTPHVSND